MIHKLAVAATEPGKMLETLCIYTRIIEILLYETARNVVYIHESVNGDQISHYTDKRTGFIVTRLNYFRPCQNTFIRN